MPKITTEQLHQIFTGNGTMYPLYAETVKLHKELKIHAEGIVPLDLIGKRRPSENEEIRDYRNENYQPVTKLPISKAINCYGKIRRSPDWMIKFPGEKVTAKIADNETLEKYCTENLPGFVSITNWAFDILLPQNLLDANAKIAVIPLEAIKPDKFIKPVPIIFNSDQILYCNELQKIAVLKSRVQVSYLDTELNAYKNGDRFYYIDDTEIIIYEQNKDGYGIVSQITNITKQFPVFGVKSERFKQYDNMSVNRSRLHAMVPFLNKAAVCDSDYDGSSVMHKYPLFWYYQNKNCNSCNGSGKVPAVNENASPTSCAKCEGSGKIVFSPFAHIQVDPAQLGHQSNPVPPAGYIQRDIEILKLMAADVDKYCLAALASINMQFLDQTPLSISGDAKQVDREELNNTVYNTAEDIIYSIDKAIYFINEWRYSYVVSDTEKRKMMLPQIPVPQNYDLLPEDYLMKEVTDARTAKVNPLLVATLEQQMAAKKFYNQPELANNIKLFFDLDPLPGLSTDEKMTMLTNQGITKEDYIISNYMAAFIKRALREDPDFCKNNYDAQMKVLNKYAKEKITATDAATQMIEQQKQKQKVIEEMQQQKLNQPQA